MNLIEQEANVQNRNLYANYTVGVQNWAENGMQGSPPAAPKYESVNVNGFNQWWSEYTSNMAAGAPPATFVTNEPQDNGYGGAAIFSGFSV